MSDKPNCYECVHRGEVPGSCHSSCKRTKPTKVKGNEHGIKSGWFNYPFNFDPVWLEKCDGFEGKSKQSASQSASQSAE